MPIKISPDTQNAGRGPRVMRTVKALINGTWYGALEETPEIRHMLRSAGEGFHHQVSADASSEFPAEAKRYHLYVSYACPWAHRTIIYRKLKGLENAVSMSVLHPRWAGPEGWYFADSPMSTSDHIGGRCYLYEVYQAARSDYTGRVTVPVLWDRKRETIVNNESGEIIRMLNSAFNAWGDSSVDFYPADLRAEIDTLNTWLIPNICIAVYKAGFANSQDAYDRAVQSLFECLDEVEKRLTRQPYLLGQRITESDWHLFTTLCRFDAVYFGALKCNLRRLIDYPALSAYARRLQQISGVAETVRFDHIKRHYYDAIGEIDSTIVPRGPSIDYTAPKCVEAANGFSGAKESESHPVEEEFRREVLELHEYLEDWLKGKIPQGTRGPARLENALAKDFFVIHPNGMREDKTKLVQNFASSYGNKPADYALRISDISVRVLGNRMCLVTYKESHRGESRRTRVSTALLRQLPDCSTIEWLFLQETLFAEPEN